MTKSSVKITSIIGAILLVFGAVFHMSALPDVKTTLAPVEAGFFKNAFLGMWVMPSAHWVFIAFLSVGLSRYKSNACAAILMAFGCWVLADALMIFMHVGSFVGAYVLALAGLLFLGSGLLLRGQVRTD